MKLLKKIDHNILSLLGMYAVVLIAMAIFATRQPIIQH